jgi:hypothetical protein
MQEILKEFEQRNMQDKGIHELYMRVYCKIIF